MMQHQSKIDNTGTRSAWGKSRLVTTGVALALASVLLAVIGPFNTYGNGPFGQRLTYWTGLTFASWVLGEVVLAFVRRFVEEPVYLRETITISIFVPLFTPILIGWTALVLPSHQELREDMLLLTVYLLAICGVISAARHGVPIVIRRHIQSQQSQDMRPRLEKRLPEDFDGKVLRLAADGHQVTVVTTSGQFDIRMRLGDAILEMDGVRGYSVHRSHWVSAAAIIGACAKRGRPVLVLENGDHVPVGAKHQPGLEAAGILSAERGIDKARA